MNSFSIILCLIFVASNVISWPWPSSCPAQSCSSTCPTCPTVEGSTVICPDYNCPACPMCPTCQACPHHLSAQCPMCPPHPPCPNCPQPLPCHCPICPPQIPGPSCPQQSPCICPNCPQQTPCAACPPQIPHTCPQAPDCNCPKVECADNSQMYWIIIAILCGINVITVAVFYKKLMKYKYHTSVNQQRALPFNADPFLGNELALNRLRETQLKFLDQLD